MRLLWLCATWLLLTGCGAESTYGSVAWYSPNYAGYIITEQEEPHASLIEDVHLLRSPLTQEKLVCREDVLRFLGASTTMVDNKQDASTATSSGVFNPLTLVSVPVYFVGTLGLRLGTIQEVFVTDADTHLRRGEEAFARGDFRLARDELLASVAFPDQSTPFGTKFGTYEHTLALRSLGDAHFQLGEREQAREAYRAFLRRAVIPAGKDYAHAEARLRELGEPERACKGRGAVRITWPG